MRRSVSARSEEVAVPGPGRNERCPCGSGRKVKRCCGQKRGSSAEQLAHAHLASRAQEAVENPLTSLKRHSRSSWKACSTYRASTFPCTSVARAHHSRAATTPRRPRRKRSRTRLGRATGTHRTDRHPSIRRPPRRRNHPTTRPAPSDPHTGRIGDLRARYRSQHLVAASVTHTVAVAVASKLA